MEYLPSIPLSINAVIFIPTDFYNLTPDRLSISRIVPGFASSDS